jgi:hypothetical protein
MKKTVDKIPFYRLGWNKFYYFHNHKLKIKIFALQRATARIIRVDHRPG